jgi:hypothetical protein
MSEHEDSRPGTEAESTDGELTDTELEQIDGGAYIDPALPRVILTNPTSKKGIWGTGGTTKDALQQIQSLDDPLFTKK